MIKGRVWVKGNESTSYRLKFGLAPQGFSKSLSMEKEPRSNIKSSSNELGPGVLGYMTTVASESESTKPKL